MDSIPESPTPAHPFRRLCALGIDFVLLGICTSFIWLHYFWMEPILFLAYFSLMESSQLKATVGKKLLGIQVVDVQGQTLSFPRALGRNLCKLLGLPILIFFAIPMLFSDMNQGLHDMAVDSYVVKAPDKDISKQS